MFIEFSCLWTDIDLIILTSNNTTGRHSSKLTDYFNILQSSTPRPSPPQISSVTCGDYSFTSINLIKHFNSSIVVTKQTKWNNKHTIPGSSKPPLAPTVCTNNLSLIHDFLSKLLVPRCSNCAREF